MPPPTFGRGRSVGSNGPRDRERLIELRRRFIREGIEPGEGVSSVILRSWRRSGALGLDMDRRPALESLTHAQLREIRERNEILLRAARGELELLHEDARLTGGIAILTDPDGTVLATVGNIDFAERASRVALRPGVQWSEAAIGTNAIGTAIAEGSPITVSGGEHFFEAQAILGCSAVPIFDPSGELIGVLDFSNDAGVPQTHTLALVRRAVEQIEHRLFEQRFGRHVRMHFHADPDLVMSPHEGLLAFDDSCLVGANRQGLDLLGLDWSALGVLGFDQIFDTGRDQIVQAGPTEPSRIRTRRGSVLFGRIEEKYEGAATVHRAPRLRPTEEGSRAPFDHRVRALLDRAVRLVDAGVSILVRGEVGCGKEAFAREVHAGSRRRGGPFVMVDCSEENAADLERSLFGTAGSGGALQAAIGGCLFLHTVEVLPLALQARLVRALAGAEDDGTRPLGREFDLLSSSHWILADRVAAGAFSPDLMIRLAAHTIELEPLRAHPDRRALIDEIWRTVAPLDLVDRLPEETRAVLAAHGWPGNRRQLIATLRSLVVLAEAGEPLVPEVLPHEIRQVPDVAASDPPVAVDVEEGLGAITLAAMRAALEAEGGNVSRAARRLGIHRSTLYRHLQNSEASKP